MSEVPEFIEGERVSALAPGRRVGVVVIRVGDRVAGRISERDVVEIGVRTGTLWTEELARRVEEADETERARVVARRMLNARMRSRAELIEKITGKEFSAASAARVADELERAGLIDDARLAASLVGSLRRRGGAGRRLMEQKLRARKIGREVSDAAIEGALAGVDPYEEALALARGRAARMKSDTDRAARTRRLHGFLARRGYEGDVCWRVVREVVGGDTGDG